MTIAILAVLIAILFYSAYIFSVATSGLYLSDYDEQKFISSLSGRRLTNVRFLIENPRRLAVTSSLLQSGTLMVTTVFWFIIGASVGLDSPERLILQIGLILVGWMLYFFLTSFVAPNLRQEQVLKVIQGRAWLIRLLMAITGPFVNSMIRVKGRMQDKEDYEERKEELVERAIEELADSAGFDEPLMEPDIRQMIGNVFELTDSEVREVMVPRIEIIALEKGSRIEQVQKVVAETGYSRFPVYENDIDNIVGVLYVKDIFKKYPLPTANDDLTQLVRPAYFVPESKPLKALLEEFKLQKLHIAIVVDEYGGTAGLVTMEDLLELIVGDIQDEHDTEEEELVQVRENEFLVSANLSMYDLSEKLDLALEEKDFETVGGYIYDLVGSLPQVGQRVSADGVDYIVQKVNGQRIEKVRVVVTRKSKAPDSNGSD
jgi:CBS domain containing-hemolysin-like protein